MITSNELRELGKKAGKCLVYKSETVLKCFYWITNYSHLLVSFIEVEIRSARILTTYTKISMPLECHLEDFAISCMGPLNFPDFNNLSF